MKPFNEISKKELKNIKLIIFDVDGVLVKRGTKIKQKGDFLEIQIKKIADKQINQIKKLHELDYKININSGRGLYMLEKMFFKILPFVSITYENGSATWLSGKIYQHVNSYSKLKDLYEELKKVKHKNIKGFEPKEFIITIHCKQRVPAIEKVVSKHKGVYWIWNDEAYDIGLKGIQTKAYGLKSLIKLLKLSKKNVLALGDNYNDRDLLSQSRLSVTADKSRLKGNYYVFLDGKTLPADQLMSRIISLH